MQVHIDAGPFVHITLDVKATYTVGMLKAMLQVSDLVAQSVDNQRMFKKTDDLNELVDNLSLEHYQILDNDRLNLMMRGRAGAGGGPRGPKKHVLKHKKAAKAPSDLIFKVAIESAIATADVEQVDFKQVLKNTSIDKLHEMLHFVKHDHTTNKLKLSRLADYSAQLISILEVHAYLEEIITKCYDLMHDSVVTACDGLPTMATIAKMIEIQLEVKMEAARLEASNATKPTTASGGGGSLDALMD